MKLKYIGDEKFNIKVGKMVYVKHGVIVDFPAVQAEEFSKKKINGEKQWTEVGTQTPKKKKKGDE